MAAVAAPHLLPAPPAPLTTAYYPSQPHPRLSPRRFDNGTLTTSTTATPTKTTGADCAKFDGFSSCSSTGQFASCLSGTGAAYCNCNVGMAYLGCVEGAVEQKGCGGLVGVDDWDAYERSWFQASCPTPPSTVMTQLPQPTSVSVDLQPVVTVTPTAPITEPPRTAVPPPAFSNGGDLLAGPCSSASYTLVSDGDLVLYAAFVGCDAGRPQCCPWNVSTEAAPVNPGAGGEGNGTPKGNRVAALPGQFPVPAADAKEALERCPRDYYSVSGQCCPNGYYKFTRPIAFQTPCFSSLSGSLHASPPPITAGLAANPRDSSVPTSAIVNLAWAMGYNVSGEPTTALSKGAVIGIGVGSGVGVIVVVTVLAFLVIRWRRARKAATGGGGGGGVGQGVSYHEGYHAPGQEMAHVGGFKMVEYGGSGSGGGGSGGQQQWEGGQQELGGRQQQWEGRYGYSRGYQPAGQYPEAEAQAVGGRYEAYRRS